LRLVPENMSELVLTLPQGASGWHKISAMYSHCQP